MIILGRFNFKLKNYFIILNMWLDVYYMQLGATVVITAVLHSFD
jgi:hypothetical protein